jgi:hypothetical protein
MDFAQNSILKRLPVLFLAFGALSGVRAHYTYGANQKVTSLVNQRHELIVKFKV